MKEKRLQKLFDGWIAQFENMPDYKPDIQTKDGEIFVDEQPLCNIEAKFVGAGIDVEGIVLYTIQDDKEFKLLLNIEWQDGSQPFVKEIIKV